MKPRPWKPPHVEVQWVDAAGYISFNGTLPDMVQRSRLRVRHTSGYLIHEDGEEVASPTLRRTILAHDYDPPDEPDDEPEVGNITVIPSMWITKVTPKGNVRKKKPPPTV